MGKASRDKGARGEREVVRLAQGKGVLGVRSAPMQAGQKGYDDVRLNGFGFEVKRCETYRMSEWLKTATRVIFRRSGEEWRVVVPLDEYLHMLRAYDSYWDKAV